MSLESPVQVDYGHPPASLELYFDRPVPGVALGRPSDISCGHGRDIPGLILVLPELTKNILISRLLFESRAADEFGQSRFFRVEVDDA